MGFHILMLLTIDRAPVGMFAVVFPIWSHSSFRTAVEVLLNHQFVAVQFAAPFVMVMKIMTATALIPIAAAAALVVFVVASAGVAVAIVFVALMQ